MSSLRTIEGIRTELFYIETVSTLGFQEVGLERCGEGSQALCGEIYVEGGDGYLFVDLVGEGTLYVGDDVYAVFKTPAGGHDNRFVPVPRGRSRVLLRPSVLGPFGERIFSLRGLYLYVKEPWTFRFVIEANILADMAEYTRDKNLLIALNKALDQIDIEGITEWQFRASTIYSVTRPPFYISSIKYYDMKIGLPERPMDPSRLAEMGRRALEVLHTELDRVYREVRGPEGVVYAVGHAHIDVAWLWPPDVTRQKVVRTLSNVLTLAKKYDMKFVLSNMVYLRWLREDSPELYKRVLEAVREGVIVPVGGMWVESDTNTIGGESLVRQFLYGQRTLLEETGSVTEIGWLPDSFGFTGSLPQIMRKSGIKIFFTHKLYWNRQNRFPYSLFRWEGVDGTEIIAVNYATYGSDLSPAQVVGAWRDHTSPETPAFIAFGFGDGGGGPTWYMMERLRVYSRTPGAPRLVLADPYRYYEAVRSAELPRWRGELYVEIHRGTYSTGHRIKRLIRILEEKLKDLETVSYMVGEKRSYRDLWETLLEAEFHDTASATVVEEAYRHYIERLERLEERVEEEIRSLLRRAVPEGEYIVVVNTLPWDRTDIVEGPVKGSVQQVIEGRVYSLVSVPAMSIVALEPGGGVETGPLYTDEKRISNGVLEVGVDGSVRDLENGVEAVKRSFIVACRDIPAEWDGWDIDPWYTRNCRELAPVETSVVERGPLRACIERRYLFRNTELRERICLWRGSRRVDFVIRGSVGDRLVLFRELFELGFEPVSAESEIPYGVIRRSIEPESPWDEAKFEFPVWRWIDVYSMDYGLALINRGRSGHSLNKRVLGITLLKTPIFPNPRLDLGDVEIEFALYPHRGTWRDAEIPRRALEYHRPLRAVRGSRIDKRLLRIDLPNILLETVKLSEDGSGYVARAWETYGRRAVLRLGRGETDLVELRSEEREEIVFGPYEIKTIVL